MWGRLQPGLCRREVEAKARKGYSPKVDSQVVFEALAGEKTPGQIAKEYGIHPNSAGLSKKEFL
jgi:hypothetical protein